MYLCVAAYFFSFDGAFTLVCVCSCIFDNHKKTKVWLNLLCLLLTVFHETFSQHFGVCVCVFVTSGEIHAKDCVSVVGDIAIEKWQLRCRGKCCQRRAIFLSWGEKTEKSKFLFAEKRLKCAGEGELEPKVGSRARATRVARIVGWFYSLIVLFSYKNIWLGKSLSYEFVDVAEGVFGRIVIFFIFFASFVTHFIPFYINW